MKPSYCLITGASSGIGTQFAYQYAELGNNLILTGRNKTRLEFLKSHLESRYSIIVAIIPLDLSVPNSAQTLYDEVERLGISVPYLVNSAGFGELQDFLDTDWIRLQQMMQVNMYCLSQLCYLFGNKMRKAGGGQIINVASCAGFSGGPHMAMYYATKNFVLSLSEGLSVEFLPYHVSVTALCPGPTKTGFEEHANMGKSVMFSMFPPENPEKTAQAGMHAAFRRKPAVYHGFVSKVFNIISRLLPRRIVCKITARVNRKNEK